MVYDMPSSRRAIAWMLLVAVDLGSNNSLGIIIFTGDGRQLSMKDYSSKLSTLSLYVSLHYSPIRALGGPFCPRSRTRKFKASDRLDYVWVWRAKSDQEWTVNISDQRF
jgi:hypothetical protein